MPDPIGGARRRIHHAWRLLVETFERFDADGVPRLAAAMSYFLLLAVAPLLLILNGVLGLVGVRLGMGSVPAIEDAGATAATGIQQAVAWAGSYAPYVALMLVVVGGVSVFGQFIGALEVIWDTPPRRTPLKGFLRFHALSLALLLLAAVALHRGPRRVSRGRDVRQAARSSSCRPPAFH